MDNEEQIVILMNRIRELQKEIEDNPQYHFDIVDSIYDDIHYYQNQIEFLTHET